jgi:GT2 family glycosyltransferase
MPEPMSFSALTVIIPTYNRESLLLKALAGYSHQSQPQLIHELLVVDDGSTDGTEDMVRNFASSAPFKVRYLRQANRGPAAARNLGIRNAASSLVLFSDSDIIPERDMVEQHLHYHQQNPQTTTAVLGYVTWSREVNATPFMRWYGEDGALFRYRNLRGKAEADYRFFYTCNLSLKADFLRSCGYFDEDFKTAAFEDTDLGYRLSKQGLRLLYNPRAIGYHDQFFSFEEACRKGQMNSAPERVFFQKESGQRALREIQRRRSTILFRVAKPIAAAVAAALQPTTALLDSRIRLPDFVYRLFYWYNVSRAASVTGISSQKAEI